MKLRTKNIIWIIVYTISLALSVGFLLYEMSELSCASERFNTAQMELHRQKNVAQELRDADSDQDSDGLKRLESLLSKTPASREKFMTTVKNITRQLNIENPLITLDPTASMHLPNEQMIDIQPVHIEFIAPSDLLGYDLVECFLNRFEAVVAPYTLRLENISGTESTHKIRHHIGFYVLNFNNKDGSNEK